jgi:hypothetical protein
MPERFSCVIIFIMPACPGASPSRQSRTSQRSFRSKDDLLVGEGGSHKRHRRRNAGFVEGHHIHEAFENVDIAIVRAVFLAFVIVIMILPLSKNLVSGELTYFGDCSSLSLRAEKPTT